MNRVVDSSFTGRASNQSSPRVYFRRSVSQMINVTPPASAGASSNRMVSPVGEMVNHSNATVTATTWNGNPAGHLDGGATSAPIYTTAGVAVSGGESSTTLATSVGCRTVRFTNSGSRKSEPIQQRSDRRSDTFEEEEDKLDFAAVQEACNYVKAVFTRFNSQLDSLHPASQRCIQDLNTHLGLSAAGAGTSGSIYRKAVHSGTDTDVEMAKVPLVADAKKGIKQRNSAHQHDFRLQGDQRNRVLLTTDTEEEEEEHVPHRRHPRRRDIFSNEALFRALTRLDNRCIPKPELFDLATGRSFNQFILKFEEYCQHTFRGSSSGWVNELGRFLQGEMHEAFVAVKVPGDNYEMIRDKLLLWVQDNKETYEKETKSRFKQAECKPNETMRLYAARLEQAFRLAYPHREVQTSQTLRQKYCDTIPHEFSLQLQSYRSFAHTLNQGEMTWANILTLASRYDAQHKTIKKEPIETLPYNDVWFHDLSKPSIGRRVCEAATQYVPQENAQYYSWQASAVSPPMRNPAVWRAAPTKPLSHTRSHSVSQDVRDAMFLRDKRSSSVGPSSRSNELPERRTCNYCNRRGHLRRDCRRRLGLCLVCGDNSHRIAQCPNRRNPNDLPTVGRRVEDFRHAGSNVSQPHHGSARWRKSASQQLDNTRPLNA